MTPNAPTHPPDPAKEKKSDPAWSFLWLVVGLAPIPILLGVVSSHAGYGNTRWDAPLFIICGICSLVGGLGCVGFIKNIAVRIIVGLFLAVGFLLLSWLIAAFAACSQSGGI
jgi:hypothetical protein